MRRVTASSITVTAAARRVRPSAKTARAAPVAATATASQTNPLRSM